MKRIGSKKWERLYSMMIKGKSCLLSYLFFFPLSVSLYPVRNSDYYISMCFVGGKVLPLQFAKNINFCYFNIFILVQFHSFQTMMPCMIWINFLLLKLL
ncbi:hypothetical protein WN943_004500 [Citrus x changshan-huyou]